MLKHVINIFIIVFFGFLSLYFVLISAVIESLVSLLHGLALFFIHEALQKVKK